jgi:hypothetical protein
MLSLTDHQLARDLADHRAIIVKEDRADAYPAYAYGDRRKRPLRWVSDASFRNLNSFGGLEAGPRGYGVTESFARRLKAGDAHAHQHRNIEEREIYIDSGVKRPVRINSGMTAFDRLSRRKDNQGQALLSDAEQEAGRRLIHDYACAGHGHVATQNYMSAGEDKGHYSGGAEDAHIRRIDSAKRYEAARLALGEGLDKAVLAICCHDQRLEHIERAEKWARGTGLTLLKMGLMRLVKHYGTQAGRAV